MPRPPLGLTRAAMSALLLAGIAFASPAGAASESGALQLLGNPVASDATLARLIGSWRGAGTVRQGSASADERVSCRLTNSWASQNRLMRLQLSCQGVDYRFSATGFIGRAASSYRGTVSSTTGDSAIVSGRRSGGGLALTLTSTRGQRPPAAMSIRVSGSRITNTLTRSDPKTGQRYTALNVTLQR